MLSLLLTVLALYHIARPALGAAFVGCVSSNNVQSPSTVDAGFFTQQADCNAECAGIGFAFAYWYNGGCLCDQDGPRRSDTTAAIGAEACPSDYLPAYRVVGAFAFDQCYTSTRARVGLVEYDIDIPNPTLAECFDACPAGDATASLFVYLPIDSTEYRCKCTSGRTPLTDDVSACGTEGTGYFYSRAASPRTSPGNLRRRAVARLQGQDRYCPKGLKPCLASPDAYEEDYECLDVSSELESCGGCKYGTKGAASGRKRMGAAGSRPVALASDCTDLEGANPHAATCQLGRCVSYACYKGYELVEGTCQREASDA